MKRNYSTEEVQRYMSDHNQMVFYMNKEDGNLFVRRKFSLRYTLNFGNPTSWILIGGVVLLFFVGRFI
ncbi:MAG: hypothetical protein R3Y47_06055 [Lachnospiraceae bacterium]